MKSIVLTLVFAALAGLTSYAQPRGYWHNTERELRYTPDGEDFVIVNGDKKFNKALYGTNTAFRIETSDVPEFGFFMPNMGGNMQLGLIKGAESLWLNNAQHIKSIYRPGARIYEIKDPILGAGKISIYVLAMADAEGLIMKIETENIALDTELMWMYGGASNKKFSRNGDLGADPPNSFALTVSGCSNNKYIVSGNSFELQYGFDAKGSFRSIEGLFPANTVLKTGSPSEITSPTAVWASSAEDNKPVILARTKLKASEILFVSLKNKDKSALNYAALPSVFDKAEIRRKEIANTVKIKTPDPYFNTLGGVLSTAADGIWDGTCWQHGAIGWRMPLNGWRAAYVGDAIGWHDRARTHFDGYAASQVTTVEPVIPHPTQDKKLNLARAEKVWGTQMYSNGYISRNPDDASKMHHYDMNLCYIDELLWHFNWTGDMEYVKKMWPVLVRHLAWEKRNFDPNDDGLYDAYASIWASDALQYNSGGVTHSSAYNYRANKMASEIAAKIGQNPKPYAVEAEKILNAINAQLWLDRKGRWAEYKDLMGNQLVHPDAAIWTVYHAIDSDIHSPFQAYQATRYIDTEIPHIPVLAKGLKDEDYKTISTTNWLPYSWSINNVAFAEVAHTCLAYWQAGRNEEAFKLFKSSVLDGMYLGDTPGNIGQISFYDAARGECYRDFGDPVGVYSRALIQGLFGILPDAMNNRLAIRPGFPVGWESASVSTSDIDFDFQRSGLKDTYTINAKFPKQLSLDLYLKARKDKIKSLKINGKTQAWTLEEGIESPLIKIHAEATVGYTVELEWEGADIEPAQYKQVATEGEDWTLATHARIKKLYDPQTVLKNAKTTANSLQGTVAGELGHRSLFVQLEQGQMSWWQPIALEVTDYISVDYNAESEQLQFSLKNNSQHKLLGQLVLNGAYKQNLNLVADGKSEVYTVPNENVRFGTNELEVIENGKVVYKTKLINWNLKNPNPVYETVNIDAALNASVRQIFKNEYLSPRSPYTTLQVPTQGIGEWCHPDMSAEIDDAGLRKASQNNEFKTPFGIPFRTTSERSANNIAFTTLWDNYPEKIVLPLSGKSAHAYLLMAGSANHMQCHITNGTVVIRYKDGTSASLVLVNPDTWAPIEQDFFVDGEAFQAAPRPYRVALKTGLVSRNLEKDMNIRGVYGRSINGGAGIILDLPLNKNKELQSMEIKAVANEVIIGLMAVTLLR
ncbi:DUF4450 domain-containing protein [Viscerimonas tarda]